MPLFNRDQNAQFDPVEQRAQRQNAMRDRFAQRPQPVSQMDKPLGPGGPQMSQQQMADLVAKMNMQRAGQGGGFNTNDTPLGAVRADESGTLHRSTGVMDPRTLPNRFNDETGFGKFIQDEQRMNDLYGRGFDPNSAAMPYYGSGVSRVGDILPRFTAPAPVSNDEVNAFVQAHMNDPRAIADAAQKYGVGQKQLMDATGYSNEQIGNFFRDAGMANPFATVGNTNNMGRGVEGDTFNAGPRTSVPFWPALNKLFGGNLAGGNPQARQPMMGGVSGQPMMGGGPQVSPQPTGVGFGPDVNNFGGGFAKPAGAFGSAGSQSAFGGQPTAGFGGAGITNLLGRK